MEIEETTIPLNESVPKRLRPRYIIPVLILVLSSVALYAWAQATDGLVRVHMLGIGQGDAVLIMTATGNQILIDGGPDGTILSKLGEYLPSWDRDLDMVIATHKDSDHINGLIAVLERYEVSHIVHGLERSGTAVGRKWDASVAAEDALVTEGVSGVTIDIGASTSLEVLYPYASRAGTENKDANNNSIVIMLKHENVRMLLTGDAESPVERQLVVDGAVVKADVLKAGHHGSKTSTTPEFLTAVGPQAVLISVGGNNRYGHPHLSVLERLEQFGIPYYRTDQKGDVTVTSDGRSFFITTER